MTGSPGRSYIARISGSVRRFTSAAATAASISFTFPAYSGYASARTAGSFASAGFNSAANLSARDFCTSVRFVGSALIAARTSSRIAAGSFARRSSNSFAAYCCRNSACDFRNAATCFVTSALTAAASFS